ncbi:MAG: hypothetical protein KBG25_05100 [Paludibacteraceae bacterium]|nr:hypothetical protein [Paludibacteraceae bacterium]
MKTQKISIIILLNLFSISIFPQISSDKLTIELEDIPNPLNAATKIAFYLPTTISIANVYVYDMNETQLKSYPITERGKGNVIIQGSEFVAVICLYGLIVDGNEVDVKRMILTE